MRGERTGLVIREITSDLVDSFGEAIEKRSKITECLAGRESEGVLCYSGERRCSYPEVTYENVQNGIARRVK